MSRSYRRDNRKKLYLLVGLRYVLIACCTIAVFLQGGGWNFANPLYLAIWWLLSGIFVLNGLYLVLIPFLDVFLHGFITLQLLIDFLTETILVYLTGGIFSVFTSLYFVSIILAGTLISPNNSLVCASVATIGISGIALIYFMAAIHNAALPFLPRETIYTFLVALDLPFCKAYLFAQGVAFYLVAFLSSRLATTISRERILQKEILQNLTDGVLVVDNKQHIVFINSSAKNILGLAASFDLQGASIAKALDAERHKDILKAVRLQRPCFLESQICFERVSIPVQLLASTIFGSGKVRAVIIIIRDLTQQKRMEEAILRSKRMTAISEAAAMIAHEIRNPLTSIRGAIQELQDIIPREDPRYVLMNITIRESDRINRIITDFLEFSRIRRPVFQKCDVGQLLAEVAMLLSKREDLDENPINMKIEKNLIIHGDAEQLKQIFYNLGINGIEASSRIDISVTAHKKNGKDFLIPLPVETPGVQVAFHDKGNGIDKAEMGKIFTPFYTTKDQGTGMGLAFVNKVLDFHRALCHIDSEVAKGTSFYLWFPENPELIFQRDGNEHDKRVSHSENPDRRR